MSIKYNKEEENQHEGLVCCGGGAGRLKTSQWRRAACPSATPPSARLHLSPLGCTASVQSQVPGQVRVRKGSFSTAQEGPGRPAHSLWVESVPAHPHVSSCLQDLPGAGHPGSHWEQLGALLSWPQWGPAQVNAVGCRTPRREGWRLSASFQASCTL